MIRALVLSVLPLLWNITTTLAQEIAPTVVEVSEEVDDAGDIVHYGLKTQADIKIKKLTPEEDDLYDGGEIKPLRGTLSATEKMQKGGSFEDDDEPRLPDLQCSDEKLREQVGKFVYEFAGKQIKNTVPAKREQVLMVRNIKTFEDADEKELKKNFEASAALIYLKMNKNREIYKICASKNNKNKKFRDFYIILYPYLNFYKVVVTNFISNPEKMDEATFIYNW